MWIITHQDCTYCDDGERVYNNIKRSESEKLVNNNNPEQKQLVYF